MLLPAGHTAATVLHAGGGITSTMLSWGGTLLRRSGKRADAWKEDFSLSYLGYTTDNGGGSAMRPWQSLVPWPASSRTPSACRRVLLLQRRLWA